MSPGRSSSTNDATRHKQTPRTRHTSNKTHARERRRPDYSGAPQGPLNPGAQGLRAAGAHAAPQAPPYTAPQAPKTLGPRVYAPQARNGAEGAAEAVNPGAQGLVTLPLFLGT